MSKTRPLIIKTLLITIFLPLSFINLSCNDEVRKNNNFDDYAPIKVHGQLSVCGTHLCDEQQNIVQLRGMSTHGLQWYGLGNCVTEESLDALAFDWGADILRISLYIQEGGYETDPDKFTNQVHQIIEKATERGLYALIDWHMLSPGDPMLNLKNAKTFFSEITNTHRGKTNILYEIANEPSGVSWDRIKEYADIMIPFIHQNDPEAVIIVGTPAWTSLGVSEGRDLEEILQNPLTHENVMYSFHFYAGSHGDNYRETLTRTAEKLPIFVTEFGTQEYTGDGPNDFDSTQQYLDILDEYRISWINWNYSHDHRSGAVWKEGTCPDGPWVEENLKEAGLWVREKIRTR